MPAAGVIPAPIAYIKVAAVKKLVVGFGQFSIKEKKPSRQDDESGENSSRPICSKATGGSS